MSIKRKKRKNGKNGKNGKKARTLFQATTRATSVVAHAIRKETAFHHLSSLSLSFQECELVALYIIESVDIFYDSGGKRCNARCCSSSEKWHFLNFAGKTKKRPYGFLLLRSASWQKEKRGHSRDKIAPSSLVWTPSFCPTFDPTCPQAKGTFFLKLFRLMTNERF